MTITEPQPCQKKDSAGFDCGQGPLGYDMKSGMWLCSDHVPDGVRQVHAEISLMADSSVEEFKRIRADHPHLADAVFTSIRLLSKVLITEPEMIRISSAYSVEEKITIQQLALRALLAGWDAMAKKRGING